MTRYANELNKISQSKMGVSSGVYSVLEPRIKTRLNEFGEYGYVLDGALSESQCKRLLNIDMMSSLSANEDVVGRELFSGIKDIKHDPNIGYFLDLYAGYVAEGNFRKNGSSGGMTSWILAELLRRGEIDGVIHAHSTDPTKNNGTLFKYVISRTAKDIKLGSKSRYYPMELSEVLASVKENFGNYAIVGIPEFIMEVRLLAKEDKVINKRIKYAVGLVCGHQKSTKYAEALAWQHGIKPGDLQEIDFRVKQPDSTAIDYLHKFTGLIDGKKVTFTKNHSELLVENWGAGFFKTKFSDFTDNTFNEVADVVLGDAWLPEYNKDGMGNNIVIVRNPKLAKLIREGLAEKKLILDKLDVETIKNSQKGLIHHTRDELPYRLYKYARRLGWKFTKRIQPSNKLNTERKKVQDIRYTMARQSHISFRSAVERGSWEYFAKEMEPLLEGYKKLYGSKSIEQQGFIKVVGRKLQPRTRAKKVYHGVKNKTRVRTRVRNVLLAKDRWLKSKKYNNPDGAIITLTGHYNFGNILQRYALQEFLRKNGLYFVSLKYDHTGLDQARENIADRTKGFVKNRIVTKEFHEEDQYKTFVVGSDQVWRRWNYKDVKKELGYYFLNFTDKPEVKRVSYAASLGHGSVEDVFGSREIMNYIKPFIQKFDYISVREKSGAEIVTREWGVNARVVVDPVMLLSKDDYSTLIKKSLYQLSSTAEVFAYVLSSSPGKERLVDSIAEAKDGKVERVYLGDKRPLCAVEQWLKGFRDSEFVVTDSFHGTVLAIINNTPFIVIENKGGGVDRLINLLGVLGLEDRLVYEKNIDEVDIHSLPDINWKKVNAKLVELRKESGDWLLGALRGGK